LVGGRIAANAEVVGDKTGYALTAAEKDAIISAVSGTADASTTTTVDDAARTEADLDYWKDAIIVFTAGPAAGQPRRITSFNPTLDRIVVAVAWTTAPGLNPYLILRTAVAEAPGAGATDWTSAEKEQIRDALGVDGTKTAATGGDVQDLQARLPAALVTGRIDASVGEYQTGLGPLQPTVAGRTLGVNAAGHAGINLDNVTGTLAKGTEITGFNDLDAAGIRAAVGLALANLDTQLAGIGSLTVAERGAVADAIHDEVVEGTLTLRQLLRIMLAAVAGKSSGFPAGPAVYRDNADTKARITATVDADGNRSAVTLDGA
jgi:hypothetical protein